MSDDKIMTRIANLIAKAESSEYGPERDAFREKAEAMMMQHAISEAQIAAAKGKDIKSKVIKKRVPCAPAGSPFRGALVSLMTAIAKNSRCRVAYWNLGEKSSIPIDALVVGMEDDVEFVEMLFTNLRLQMAAELEPKYDSTLSLEDNVYAMRNAGMKWNRLEELCGLGPNGPAQRAYEAACHERDEEPRKRINPKTVKRNFAEGFAGRVATRMYENRKRREEQNTGSGAALVPVTNAVDEVYKGLVGKAKGRRVQQGGKADAESFLRGDAAGKRANLGQTGVRQQPRIG